jgi:hypothetical protein
MKMLHILGRDIRTDRIEMTRVTPGDLSILASAPTATVWIIGRAEPLVTEKASDVENVKRYVETAMNEEEQ